MIIDRFVIERDDLGKLLAVSSEHGYQPVGPTARDGAIAHDVLASVDGLPIGVTGPASVLGSACTHGRGFSTRLTWNFME
jgi:hypothetical protein